MTSFFYISRKLERSSKCREVRFQRPIKCAWAKAKNTHCHDFMLGTFLLHFYTWVLRGACLRQIPHQHFSSERRCHRPDFCWKGDSHRANHFGRCHGGWYKAACRHPLSLLGAACPTWSPRGPGVLGKDLFCILSSKYVSSLQCKKYFLQYFQMITFSLFSSPNVVFHFFLLLILFMIWYLDHQVFISKMHELTNLTAKI